MAGKSNKTLDPTPVIPQIVIAIHLLNTDPPRFHWIIFVQSTAQDGYKFHAIEPQIGTFSYEKAPFSLADSRSVAAACIIGRLESHSLDDFDDVLRNIPLNVIPRADVGKEPKFTCRVWVREAVRRLHQGCFLICPDVDALEQELWEYGRKCVQEIEEGTFRTATLYQAKNARAI